MDQLMNAARISSGKIVLESEDLDLVELVRAVVEDHGKLLSKVDEARQHSGPVHASKARV